MSFCTLELCLKYQNSTLADKASLHTVSLVSETPFEVVKNLHAGDHAYRHLGYLRVVSVTLRYVNTG